MTRIERPRHTLVMKFDVIFANTNDVAGFLVEFDVGNDDIGAFDKFAHVIAVLIAMLANKECKTGALAEIDEAEDFFGDLWANNCRTINVNPIWIVIWDFPGGTCLVAWGKIGDVFVLA